MNSTVSIHFPAATDFALAANDTGSDTTGYSVSSVGMGSFTGLSYTVPAYGKETISVTIQVMALTSVDIANLNQLVNGMLNASQQQQITSSSTTKGSADLSIWSFFSGGNNASYSSTNSSMTSLGLTKDQISTIINAFAAAATKMNHVSMKVTIDNSANDFSVSGDLELYTIGGTVNAGKGDVQYRMLANNGTAGSSGQTAPATVATIPLS